MGSNTSKASNESAVGTLKNDMDVNGNPDPRSPTPEIIRTPLQNKQGSKHNITKNVDLRKTFESTNGEEKLIHNNPILSAVIKNHLQSYDPRSPTQDFNRTPVITTSIIDELAHDKQILRLQSDNCASPVLRAGNDSCDSCTEASEKSPDLVVSRNLCDGFLDMTLNETPKDSEEPLGSSTASNEALENILKEVELPTKLLETNFDYVEIDSDQFENSEESLYNVDESVKTDEYSKCVPVFKILGDDPRSPSIGIERTPIVVAKIDDDVSDRNVEEMSDDTLIKVLQSTNTELRKNMTDKVKNSEGLMIYEDDTTNLEDTPKKPKSAGNSGSRTPLSCMKNKDAGHTRSKSANTLCDPKGQKNPSKIPKRISHIPRLKCLSKQPKFIQTGSSVSLKNISKTGVAGDCENTPPHSHRDRWDKDSSIVL